MAGDRLTTPGTGDVRAYLDTVPDERRRADAVAAVELMREATGAEPVLWGGSIVGFGTQRYTTADRKEREWFAVGLAPRKAALTLYGLTYYGSHQELLDRLGPHTTGKGCLYVKRLDDLDRDVLVELIERSWAENTSG
ncbi:MAG: DUF1801 domain-containing protein [Actinomycetota bacterium]|nr:DUF1801 domain-containing protein [Actinomycetota bacterium]